jgi:hypothetical protein
MSDKEIELDYGFLTQKALRQVVKDVLSITAELGDMPGDHHYYIEFLIRAPGVEVSDALLGAYPEKMTIVLQHKFDDLRVEDEHFEVTLHFKGVPDRLVIPFDAITNFVDPSVDYALRFEAVPLADEDEAEEETSEQPEEEETAAASEETSADVVSLDSFRKK